MKSPKIILVDDHRIFRQGIKNLIDIENIGNVIGEAADGNEFIELLSVHKPDVVLMDIDMPKMNGMEAIQKAIELMPDIRIIAITAFDKEDYLYSMMEMGAIGFLLKSAGINEIEKAIHLGSMGEKYYSFSSSEKNMNNFGR